MLLPNGIPISVPPSIAPFSFGDIPLNSGVFAQLQCIVTYGDLPINISWSFSGEQIENQVGISTMKVADRVSLLMINAVMAYHAGNYTCIASNPAATSTYTTSLIVNGTVQNKFYQ